MEKSYHFNKAKQIINNRRSHALELNEIAIKELAKSEIYVELNNKRNTLFLNLFNAYKTNTLTENIINEINLIDREIFLLSTKLNVKLNNFYCKKCEDTGFINGNYCECLLQLLNYLKYNNSGLNKLPSFTFANHINGLNPILDKIYPKLKEYSDNFPNNTVKHLIFNGNVGVGKSCLTAAMANAITNNGFNVQYIKAIEMNNLFLNYHTSQYIDRVELLNPLINCDLLIIDDLGVEPFLRNVTIPYLYEILESRNNKHYVITTNLTQKEILERYTERIFSRLFDKDKSLILSLTGKDLRLADKK